jgi:hypothetical protein
MKYLLILVLIALILPAAAQELGSRGNPIPIGTSADLGNNWEITVLSVVPNATEEDVCGSSGCFGFVRDPEEEFFIAKIQAKYVGPGSYNFESDDLSAVGSASVGYTSFPTIQAADGIPGYIPYYREVFTGGVITGIVLWTIPPAHANKLVMYNRLVDNNKRIYMALY